METKQALKYLEILKIIYQDIKIASLLSSNEERERFIIKSISKYGGLKFWLIENPNLKDFLILNEVNFKLRKDSIWIEDINLNQKDE